MKTRPLESVMNCPAWPKGGCGAADATPAVAIERIATATPTRIAGRLPHLAGWDVHLGWPLARYSPRSRATGRAAGLPLRLHDAPGRTRFLDRPCGLRERIRVDPARHRSASDLLAHAGRNGATGVHDRR